ncbi:type II secretion system GspH family protein [Patescibacteria group bacterium]|nr:type II secretion system GspH family protein [Patescibacteria group bacterium]
MKFAFSRDRQDMKGFTLIELLVVIAIIGILSSVVLASLNTARNKGADTAVKSNLSGARAQAELFYDVNGNSYNGVCGTTAVSGVKTINSAVLAAAQASGLSAVTVDGTGTTGTATCNDTADGWAAAAPIKSTTGVLFCVDSTGAAATTTTVLSGASDVAC